MCHLNFQSSGRVRDELPANIRRCIALHYITFTLHSNTQYIPTHQPEEPIQGLPLQTCVVAAASAVAGSLEISLTNKTMPAQTRPGSQAVRKADRPADRQKGKRTCVVRCGRHVAGVFAMCSQSDDIETLRLYQKLLVFHIDNACTPTRSPCLS